MQKRAGFTLVELLVVITIIAILSLIGITSFTTVQKNARDSRRKSDLRSIKIALELYKQTNGGYPTSDYVYSTSGNRWVPGLDFNYMAQGVPRDPIDTGNGNPNSDANSFRYAYWSQTCSSFAAGQFFVLISQLENRSDSDRNQIKDYKWCDGNGLFSTHGWSGTSFVVTSL